ncbi:MAG: Lrp/AsnC family transcriptional regulator [Saprospiraceae bacterium]|nr:Lrp/AsnC family transcriptional regulator [Bacteroidia bacterium]NNE15915.1 Lrp/AsnC family transcriptional regulator [Saprospiraceae bacterium]NNL90664.1 Lrp/AsnC family transcriptional regulator [Saprospiraceae bacterium]
MTALKSVINKLDDIDFQILSALKRNSKITVKQLSSELNLTSTPVFERIKKMERLGVIENYTININEELIGKRLIAFAHISLLNHTKKLFHQLEANLLAISDIVEVHAVSGNTDFIIKIHVKDMDDYKDFIMEKLFDVPNIGNVESFISLSMKKVVV